MLNVTYFLSLIKKTLQKNGMYGFGMSKMLQPSKDTVETTVAKAKLKYSSKINVQAVHSQKKNEIRFCSIWPSFGRKELSNTLYKNK